MQLFRRPTSSERRPSPGQSHRPFALTTRPRLRNLAFGRAEGVLIVALAGKSVYTSAIMAIRVIIAGEDEDAQYVGGVHKRPPIPDNSLKAECPKFMAHGPCGGVRKGGFCEVYPEMICPWITMFIELEKIGHTDWMKQL